MDRRIHLDENTSVPLWLVFTPIPFLIGGIMWLTTIDGKASAAQDDMKGVKTLLLDVRERVIRIESNINRGKLNE